MPLITETFKLPQVIVAPWDFRESIIIPTFTTASRPDPVKWPRRIIFVSDADEGGQFYGSDGVTWYPFGVPLGATDFTVTNGTLDFVYDANATTVNELADVLYTLITVLQQKGLLP